MRGRAAESGAAQTEFEVYVLMTMKFRMKSLQKGAQLEVKLSEQGLSMTDGERIHAKVRATLGNEESFFANLQGCLQINKSSSVRFSSLFWPEFDFEAIADSDGRLESAKYSRARSVAPTVNSPNEVPVWNMDVTDFAELFGPLTTGRQWTLSDDYLPAYDEREFEWDGWPYGVGFCWGLFIFAAQSWE